MPDVFSTFDRICIINLEHRQDRRDQMRAELSKIGITVDGSRVQFWRASKPGDAAGFPSIGAHGCFMSHLGVLRAALADNVQKLLLLEDDCDFNASGVVQRCVSALSGPRADPWDIFYGGHTGLNGSERVLCPELVELPPSCPIQGAHCIAFSPKTLASLVPFLERILLRPPGDPAGGPMHVDGAYSWFRGEHPELSVMAAVPQIAIQRPSTSDIAGSGHSAANPLLLPLLALSRMIKRRYKRIVM